MSKIEYVLDNFTGIKGNKRLRAEVDTLREMGFVPPRTESSVQEMKEFFKRFEKVFEELNKTSFADKANHVRDYLIERNKYHCIMLARPSYDESSLAKKMTDRSVIVTVMGADRTYERPDEYLDSRLCNVGDLMPVVHDGDPEWDEAIRIAEECYEKGMDIPGSLLQLRAKEVNEADVFAKFNTPYAFYTYDGDFDREGAVFIQGDRGNRKRLLKKYNYTVYTKDEIESDYEAFIAKLNFIAELHERGFENPEQLFEDIDVETVIVDGKEERHRKGFEKRIDIQPDWIGYDSETDGYVYSAPKNFDTSEDTKDIGDTKDIEVAREIEADEGIENTEE